MVDVIALIKQVGHEEGIEQGIEQGRQEGERQKSIQTAYNLLEIGLSIEQIAKATGLTEKDIRDLAPNNDQE